MPDAGGNFKGISIPALPWLEKADEKAEDYEDAPAGAGAYEVEEAPVE